MGIQIYKIAVFLLVFGVLAALLLPKVAETANDKINALNAQNDSLSQINDSLRLEVEKLDSISVVLAGAIKASDTTIVYIKKIKYEKINRIANFSNNELFEFFANRDIKADAPTN